MNFAEVHFVPGSVEVRLHDEAHERVVRRVRCNDTMGIYRTGMSRDEGIPKNNNNSDLTKHGEELLRVEVLHSPLRLQSVGFRERFKVECGFRTERVHDAQQATARIYMYM